MLEQILCQLYPSICVLCGHPGRPDRPLCAACEQDLPDNTHSCRHCACPLPASAEAGLCAGCLRKKPVFDTSWSPFLYAQPLEWMIHQFKFNAKLYMGRLLADVALCRFPVDLGKPDCIIPVPLHPRKLRQRGFNQSMELARHMGKALAIPVEHQNCYKVIDTASQTGKDARQRRVNIRHAFRYQNRQNYRHVVVLDDVVTTGSTVSELSREIKRAGVERVSVWSIARAPLGTDKP